MATIQELLEQAKAEALNRAQLDINKWAFENQAQYDALKKIWTDNLVLGHKVLGRMLLGKPPKTGAKDGD